MKELDPKPFPPAVARFTLVRTTKKPLIRWIKECLETMVPRPKYEDGDRVPGYYLNPHLADRWFSEFSAPIFKGDPGYEEAPYEVSYICAPPFAIIPTCDPDFRNASDQVIQITSPSDCSST